MAGYKGTATAGDGGTATVGSFGTAIVGDKGMALAGYGGTVRAGNGGIIVISFAKEGAFYRKVGQIGEDGLKPGIAYRVDPETCEFVEAR